jgi:hypothetical protein
VLEAEPLRVLCRRCRSWVGLEGPCPYLLGYWSTHKEQCPGESTDGHRQTELARLSISWRKTLNRRMCCSVPMQDIIVPGPVPQSLSRRPTGSRADPSSSRPIRPLPKGKGRAAASKRARSPLTLPPVPLRPRWPDEDERKQQFVDDPDVLRIEPHRLLCKNCNCWVRLHPIIRYSQSIWPQHKASCKEVLLLV